MKGVSGLNHPGGVVSLKKVRRSVDQNTLIAPWYSTVRGGSTATNSDRARAEEGRGG